ncbi:hypothetical protein HLK59_09790 [Streptomyces sp. S3(2020)]|uniref:hypothetical protein n=1 Tax=Streptomyces sp. S3(2020) TaxID=2732044 RepID=UPI001487FBC0|nr:hypothetical protein [Streptomyces sp. S3(2020)]NNN30652.1 hypothetical protein [Streptomyces sp. S3(2020)]
MSELLLAAGLAGALLCLAGHLPGSVHRWGPQVMALVGMVLMADGRLSSGACGVGVACLWSAVRACAERRGWTGSLDLAVMTLLMALMAGGTTSGAAPHTHMDRPIGAVAVLAVVAWVTARAGGVMFRQLSSPSPAPTPQRAWAYRESGAVLMIVSMAAMLV